MRAAENMSAAETKSVTEARRAGGALGAPPLTGMLPARDLAKATSAGIGDTAGLRPQKRPARHLLPATLALLLALAAPTAAWSASVTAGPDRFVVPMGETFDYILTLTDGLGRDPPDVSALTRDFEIVDRRRTSQAEMRDGKPVHIDQWVMTLRPRRAGTLTLPSLTVDGLTTSPAQVQVLPGGARRDTVRAEDAGPLFVRVEAADTPAYVQSDIPVTLRIYDRIGMRGGAMDKPSAEGATFTADGGQRTYVTTIGKARYRVIEQSYLMTPQKSGTIEIPPLTLKARVPGFRGSSAGSDLAQILGRNGMGEVGEREETIRSQPVSVTVRPRPEGVTGWFLPARAVSLEQSWSAPVDAVKVGDTLTRTIRLKARGASPNQLPPLDPPPVEGLRQYAEDSRTDATLLDGEGAAVLTKTFSVVPSASGSLTLPALTVPWWNTATNRQETATLPAVTLQVRPAAGSPAPTPTALAAPQSPTQPAPPPEPVASPATAWLDPATLLAQLRAHRLGLSILTGVLVALLALLLWRPWRRHRPVANATPMPRTGRRRPGAVSGLPRARLLADLIGACRRHDAVAAHTAYAALERQGAFADADPALAAAGTDLARHLYGADTRRWNGKALRTAVERATRASARAHRPARGARLAPLYPAGR